MIGAKPRSLDTIGMAGVSSLSDDDLLQWVKDADQFSQLQKQMYNATAMGDLNAAAQISAQLQNYGNQFGNQNNRTMQTDLAGISMGHRRDTGGGLNWLDRTLNDFGGSGSIDYDNLDLGAVRDSLNAHNRDYLAGGLANSFLNKVGPIGLGIMAGGALSGAAGLTSAGALPTTTSTINIGGNLIPATTALAPTTAAASGGLLGIESLGDDVMGQALTPDELIGSMQPSGAISTSGAQFFNDPTGGLLGIDAIPASAIAQPLDPITLANSTGAVAGGAASTLPTVVDKTSSIPQPGTTSTLPKLPTPPTPSGGSNTGGSNVSVLDTIVDGIKSAAPSIVGSTIEAGINYLINNGLADDRAEAAALLEEKGQFQPFNITTGGGSATFDLANSTVTGELSPELQADSDAYGRLLSGLTKDIEGFSPEDYSKQEMELLRGLLDPKMNADRNQFRDRLFSTGQMGTTGGMLQQRGFTEGQGLTNLRAAIQALQGGRNEQNRLYNLFSNTAMNRANLENSVFDHINTGANIGTQQANLNYRAGLQPYNVEMQGINDMDNFYANLAAGVGDFTTGLFNKKTNVSSPFTQQPAGWEATVDNTFPGWGLI